MLSQLVSDLSSLWNNIYNANDWTQATLVSAILVTFIVSLIFTVRMARYQEKSFLDWMILLRETAWVFLSFRYLSALGFDWEGWMQWSWVLWGYIAITTIMALLASQREHYLARYRDRGSRWRRRQQVTEKGVTHGNEKA